MFDKTKVKGKTEDDVAGLDGDEWLQTKDELRRIKGKVI